MRKTWIMTGLVAVVGAFAACGTDGSDGSGKATGIEGGACYGNGTCDGILTCLLQTCVNVPAGEDVVEGAEVPVDAHDPGTHDLSGNKDQPTGSDSPGSDVPGGDVPPLQDLPDVSDVAPDTGPGTAHIRLVDQQQIGSNVILFVAVTTGAGTAMTGLQSSAFEVKEDDGALSPTESGLDINAYPTDYVWRTLMVLDTSKSIMDGNNLGVVTDSAWAFAQHVTDQDTQARQVGVAAFDGAQSLRPILKPTNDNRVDFTAYGQRFNRALQRFLTPECSTNTECSNLYYSERPQCSNGLCIDPSTNLYGAVRDGLTAVQSAVDGEYRKGVPRGGALVVFTDGSDHAGYAKLADVTGDIDKSRVFVFTVGLKGEIDEAALQAIGRDGSVVVQSMDQLQNGMEEVWQRVQAVGEGIYLVSYCTPARNGEHEISVKLKAYDGTLKVKFYGSSDALCDPGSISTACAGKACGEGDGGIYCGDCSGIARCDSGTCTDVCTYDSCANNNGIDCGECLSSDACDYGTCKDRCTNSDGNPMVCGSSPYDYNYSCGTCGSGNECNPKGTYCFPAGSDYCDFDGHYCASGTSCYKSCDHPTSDGGFEGRCCTYDTGSVTGYLYYEGDCGGGHYPGCSRCCSNDYPNAVKYGDGTYSCCSYDYPYPCTISGVHKCCKTCQ